MGRGSTNKIARPYGSWEFCFKKNDDGEAKLYVIVDEEINTSDQSINIYCEDAGLDFINEIVPAYEGSSQIAQYYVNKYLADSGFEIGTDDTSPAKKKACKWDGESTVAERLQSIAKKFGYEISYSYKVEGLKVVHKYVNIHDKRGDHKTIPQLRLNIEVDKITTKKSISKLATALKVTGGTPNNAKQGTPPINLKGYKYDDGNFYVDPKSGYVISKKGQEEWTRLTNETFNTPRPEASFGQIVKPYSYDTLDKRTLTSHAIAELKKIDHPEVNYDIELPVLPDNIGIGDMVAIIDDEGELYLQARVLELETSYTAETVKMTLGEYKLKSAGISEKLEELANEWAEKLDSQVLYTWIAYADDSKGSGISLDPTGKKYLGIASNRYNADVDISDPTAFIWSIIDAEGSSVITMNITSEGGTLFRDARITTKLMAHVYLNGNKLDASQIVQLGVISWYKDNSLIGTGQTLAVDENTNAVNYTARLE